MIAPIPGGMTAPFAAPVAPALAPATASSPDEFKNLLATSINATEQKQNEAQASVNRFLNGESEDLHTAAIAGQKAELSLELFLQVRNKVVQAYQEVMRMQM